MKPLAEDPFGENIGATARIRLSILGADCVVESANEALLDLAVQAFGNLPQHRFGTRPGPLHVRLVLTDHRETWQHSAEPPKAVLAAGHGLLCATMDAGNYAVIDAYNSRALVCISPGMLRHPYHARYELVELALVTLASRAQKLVPLHAACIGGHGAGLLLMGASGTGKSTLVLHALVHGMQVLSEDSAFVSLAPLSITGAPNFLHIEPEAADFLDSGDLKRQILRSPMIRRRSGKNKLEVNLRELPGRTAPEPLQAAATVFLTRRRVRRQPALKALGREALLERLRYQQPYARSASNWPDFERLIVGVPAYELRRTEHPRLAIQQLSALLD